MVYHSKNPPRAALHSVEFFPEFLHHLSGGAGKSAKFHRKNEGNHRMNQIRGIFCGEKSPGVSSSQKIRWYQTIQHWATKNFKKKQSKHQNVLSVKKWRGFLRLLTVAKMCRNSTVMFFFRGRNAGFNSHLGGCVSVQSLRTPKVGWPSASV